MSKEQESNNESSVDLNHEEDNEDNICKIKSIHFNIASVEQIKNQTKQINSQEEQKKILETNLTHDQLDCLKYIDLKRKLMFRNKSLIFEDNVTLEYINIFKPKIFDYKCEKDIKYIEFVEQKCKVKRDEAIQLLKRTNGDVYKTILIFSYC